MNKAQRLRRDYALAFNARLPENEAARRQPCEAEDAYVERWCAMYQPETDRLVRIAQEALRAIDSGQPAAKARIDALASVIDSASLSILVERITKLYHTLFRPADKQRFRANMELIVQAFQS